MTFGCDCRKVMNSWLDFEKLNNTVLYFEYAAKGCADYDWQSILYALVDYTLKPIGKISGYSCPAKKRKLKFFK